jgi:hypothetical protein
MPTLHQNSISATGPKSLTRFSYGFAESARPRSARGAIADWDGAGAVVDAGANHGRPAIARGQLISGKVWPASFEIRVPRSPSASDRNSKQCGGAALHERFRDPSSLISPRAQRVSHFCRQRALLTSTSASFASQSGEDVRRATIRRTASLG